MVGIVGVVALLAVLALSLLITRLATIALSATGLSWEAARFQARSAFTGTGFTTGESEKVVQHPVRRRVILLLMTLRSAGLVTILISLILSFVGTADAPGTVLYRMLGLAGGALAVLLLAQSRAIDGWVSRAMTWALRRWTNLDVRDYASLLHLSGNYGVMEIQVHSGDWLVGRRLADCRLPDEGVSVLGIYRDDGSYIGVPQASAEVEAGDTLILYGRSDGLKELDRRRSGSHGDQAHENAVSDQRDHVEQEEAQDAARRRKHTSA
jgi:hypothetical protein